MKMTNPRKIALGLSLAIVTIAGAGFAQAAMERDSVTTRAEAQARAQAVFARRDVNHDGKLDRADREARRAARFERLDTDRNGQLSRAEFDSMAQHGQRGPKVGGRMGRGARGDMPMGRMADTDRDGTVTQAEFTAATLRRFDRTDADRDGQVTREERRAAFQATRDGMRARGSGAPLPPAN